MPDNDPLNAHAADVLLVVAKTKLANTLAGLASGVLLFVLTATVVGSIVVLR